MALRQIGFVAALWRYPVKSLRGESLGEAVIASNGIAGDRAWALRELDRGGIMSARTWAAMLDLRATWEGDPEVMPALVCVSSCPAVRRFTRMTARPPRSSRNSFGAAPVSNVSAPSA